MKTSKHTKAGKYLFANHLTIEIIDSNSNDFPLLPFIPGEGRQYFPKPFPRKERRLRSWLNVIKKYDTDNEDKMLSITTHLRLFGVSFSRSVTGDWLFLRREKIEGG